jgi:alkylhydroperoxidase family enzyme
VCQRHWSQASTEIAIVAAQKLVTEPATGDTGRAASKLSALRESLGSPRLDFHLQPFYETWLDTFLFSGRIDPRLRELAILRVMWRCNRPFEWGQHYRHARQAGVTRDEVVSIRTSSPQRDLAGAVGVVVRAADEVVDDAAVSEQTLDELGTLFGEPGLLDEFLYVVAGYRMFATIAASKREPFRGDRAPWPPDGISPDDASDPPR